MGRKYGLGKYGAGTYDLGGEVAPVEIIWIPIPDPPPEIWEPLMMPTTPIQG